MLSVIFLFINYSLTVYFSSYTPNIVLLSETKLTIPKQNETITSIIVKFNTNFNTGIFMSYKVLNRKTKPIVYPRNKETKSKL